MSAHSLFTILNLIDIFQQMKLVTGITIAERFLFIQT